MYVALAFAWFTSDVPEQASGMAFRRFEIFFELSCTVIGLYTKMHQASLLFSIKVLLVDIYVLRRTPQNETLLLIAIRHQLEKVADKLCEMGVDLSMADTQGNSPLWVALRSRQETIATKLVYTCTCSMLNF